ncbi:hypothetical protein [Burkholderia ambifaria]|uniref:hypothetical protein n=1 Tax=Burkholderia ambifaria TaxID=152480 RepID=UPI0005A07FFE|nr:hypothetical protein [Burkholderia ambifaria]
MRHHRQQVVEDLRRHKTPADALPHLAAVEIQLVFIEIPAEIDQPGRVPRGRLAIVAQPQ